MKKLWRAIVEWLRDPLKDLGEFSFATELAQAMDCPDRTEDEGDDNELDLIETPTRDDEDQEDPEQSFMEWVVPMARTAGKEKVSTIPVDTVKHMTDWTSKLAYAGFTAKSYQFNGEGGIVSATCDKNGNSQVITPELFDAVTGAKS